MKFFDKNNRFSLLYISDSDEDEENPFYINKSTITRPKNKRDCNTYKIKHFDITSYKNDIYKNHKIYSNDKYIKLEKSVNKYNIKI